MKRLEKFKRPLSLLAIIIILLLGSCSQIEENNDPIIGIWYKVQVESTSTAEEQTVRREWIFNDAYLGRYHKYESKNLVFQTDFNWKVKDGMYIINYPGTEKESHVVSMEESSEVEHLEKIEGDILAIRE